MEGSTSRPKVSCVVAIVDATACLVDISMSDVVTLAVAFSPGYANLRGGPPGEPPREYGSWIHDFPEARTQ